MANWDDEFQQHTKKNATVRKLATKWSLCLSFHQKSGVLVGIAGCSWKSDVLFISLAFFFGTVHAHLWKKLGRIYPYNFKLIRSLHLEGCFCSSAANGCSAKKTGGISLQLCPENCQKLTAAAGAQPFLPAFSRCFVHLSMFHHLFRSGRQHKDISKWTAETLPIPSSIQNRTVLKKPGTVQFILTQLLTRLVFTTHPGNFGFETNPGAHGGSPSKRPEQEGKKMPGPSMYIDIYIYIFTYKLVGDWLRYMQT